jgi:energy-coupling factor transporter ATP-binding protein EcfA2
MAGVVDLINKSRKGVSYFHSVKYLIVGPSGSGKTTLCINLAIFTISPYNNVVYVSPQSSSENTCIVNFKEWCGEAEIPFYLCTIKDNALNFPEITDALVIIDDYYTSTGRPNVIEKLVKELFNRGRHSRNHIVYIAQCASRLQPEVIQNSNGIFVKSRVNAEKLGLNPEKLPYVDEDEWNKITPAQDHNYVKRVIIPPIKSVEDVVKKLKSKKSKTNKKVASMKEYRQIGEQSHAVVEKPKDPPIEGGNVRLHPITARRLGLF